MKTVNMVLLHIASDKRGYQENIFWYFSIKTNVVDTH